MFHAVFIIYILKFLLLQRKRLVDFADVFEQLESSDCECDEISSGEQFQDLEDIVDVDIEENTSDVAEDSDSSDDNVP